MNKKLSPYLLIILLAFSAVLIDTCKKPERIIKVKTLDISEEDIGYDNITIRGEIIDLGEEPIRDHGIEIRNSSQSGSDFEEISLGTTKFKNIFKASLGDPVPSTTYQYRAYASNGKQTVYGSNKSFTTLALDLPSLTTKAVTQIAVNTAVSVGVITSDGGLDITARGICWSTSENPTTNDEKSVDPNPATGEFVSHLSNLDPATLYYVRAYATNSEGKAYGNQVSFTTYDYNEVVDVTNPTTGKTWMDRNLGASQVARSSTDAAAYGDLYQWGRAADGHQVRTSGTTTTLSSSDTPGHGDFILAPDDPYDWRSPQNDNLWQGVSGTNNPCPGGYRLPTNAEWEAERQSWSSNDAAGAFDSPLKLPMAGSRFGTIGSFYGLGEEGSYSSSTVNGSSMSCLSFNSLSATMGGNARAYGISVRCLKD